MAFKQVLAVVPVVGRAEGLNQRLSLRRGNSVSLNWSTEMLSTIHHKKELSFVKFVVQLMLGGNDLFLVF